MVFVMKKRKSLPALLTDNNPTEIPPISILCEGGEVGRKLSP